MSRALESAVRAGVFVALVTSSSLLAACGDDDAASARVASADTPRETSAESRAGEETVDGTGREAGEGADQEAREEVDLLREVPAEIVVSSAASPGMSGASRMVDGRMETAWNSASGDLVGAFVAVSLPDDVEVTSIHLIPGFIRNYQEQDLWTANHRIKKVRVTRDGEVVVREHAFDIESTELQSIDAHGPGGLWRIEVTDVEPGTNQSWTEACITELVFRGHPGRERGARTDEGPSARVATLSGAGAGEPPVVRSAALDQRRAREWQPFEVYDPLDARLADGIPRDDEIARLLQQDHLSRVRPLRAVELSAAAPPRAEEGARDGERDGERDRVLVALYYHSDVDEDATRERMARRRGFRRAPDAPCEDLADEATCPALRLARVSIPAIGLPVVDADVEVATDVCATSDVRFALRDLDADDREELYVRVDWQTHPVCPVGADARALELIADLDTLTIEHGGELRNAPGATCGDHVERSRVVRDLNEDGHPDFLVRTVVETTDCDGEEPVTHTARSESRVLYDPASDRWKPAP